MSDTKDPRQAVYEAARREWERDVRPALQRHREALEEGKRNDNAR